MIDFTKCPICKETFQSTNRVKNKDSFYVSCNLCGEYESTYEFITLNFDDILKKKGFILSGFLRNAFRNGKVEIVTTTNFKSLIESANLPKNPIETIERILLFVYEKMDYKSISETVQISIEKDFPIFYLKNKTDFEYYLNEMKMQDIIIGDNQGLKITLNGWKKIEELNKLKTDSDQAFVAMRFHESMSNAYKLGIEPALTETGFHPYRVDIDPTVRKIDDAIISEIRRSGLLIADCTENRPAVYFEAGFAMGLGIPIIWTCREDSVKELCFDTRQYPHIIWKKESELKEQLINRIEANFPGRLRVKVKK
jgi:nucleoside 2-deoxyribosyltransferase